MQPPFPGGIHDAVHRESARISRDSAEEVSGDVGRPEPEPGAVPECQARARSEADRDWHRKLIAQKYDGSGKRAPRRPRKADEIEPLVIRMAEENRGWGYRRIQGALSNLGLEIARSTIAEVLERHGIEPSPERSRKTTWKEFLTRHWELIVAADFFTIEVWTRRRLQRFIVLFFIELSTREVETVGIAAVANGLWMCQIGRNLTDTVDGILNGKRYLIHDRDPMFTAEFLRIMADFGVKSVKRKVPPLESYTAQITARHAAEPIDHYFFMSYEYTKHRMWLLGGIERERFLREARYHTAGEWVHNHYQIREGHEIYNIEIDKLIVPKMWLAQVI